MDMYGGMGEDGVNSLGGEGGFSRIQFKLERNVEYVIAGLTDDVRAPFLYRGANLMAVVGGGGQGGYDSKAGGSGGGGMECTGPLMGGRGPTSPTSASSG